MNLDSTLQPFVIQSIKDLYNIEINGSDVSIIDTKKEFEGDVTLVCFPYTKFSGKSPSETAEEIGESILQNAREVISYNVEQGFLNLIISNDFWNHFLDENLNNEEYGFSTSNGSTIVIEYCAPNTNKPLHLGHMRNVFLGWSVYQILKATGNKVFKANMINDKGIHICKSMIAWKKFGNGETPESTGTKGDHFVGKYYVLFDKVYKEEIAKLVKQGATEKDAATQTPILLEAKKMLIQWEAGDKETVELWKKMNGWVYDGFEETYVNLGINFDKEYFESNTYLEGKKIVVEGLEQNIFFKKSDGSVWIDLKDKNLDEKLLMREDGTSVYMTQDLGTAQLKFDDYSMGKSIYVVGNEQEYHFQVLKIILQKLGKKHADGIHHLSYGMVDLPSGKMKSREGTVVDADDLMLEMVETAEKLTKELGKAGDLDEKSAKELFNTIGMGALKFFLLKIDPKRGILFDPAASVDFQGNTGPFIQYTHARIRSVLARAGEETLSPDAYDNINKLEKEVLLQILHYPDVVLEAADKYDPSVVANYVYELARLYNKFYADSPILKAPEETARAFRLKLSDFTSKIIKRAMFLLGINVPERM
ncbi:MAG: arginine--tRNA ligase [Bacteroidetes bacterium]|nr:arginine--tRNA ligase [Bacteroidota bacterium]